MAMQINNDGSYTIHDYSKHKHNSASEDPIEFTEFTKILRNIKRTFISKLGKTSQLPSEISHDPQYKKIMALLAEFINYIDKDMFSISIDDLYDLDTEVKFYIRKVQKLVQTNMISDWEYPTELMDIYPNNFN